MRSLASLVGILAIVVMAFAPVSAQDDTGAPVAWQEVISSQIEAFREGDAPRAFGYAAAGFKASFPDAETFLAVIVGSGYAPIAQSSRHSFGRYQLVDGVMVVQVVEFSGSEGRHEAIYQLVLEPDGWRVQGVQLKASDVVDV